MQGVTTNFKNAALSADRTPIRIINLTLVDNNLMPSNLTPVAATIDNTIVGPNKAINGIKTSTAHWAFADPFTTLGAGARSFPAPDIYPVGVTDDAGWWGSTASTAGGSVASETFIINYYTPVPVTQAYWYANAWTGYPVDFVVSYDTTGTGAFTTLATVTGNAATSWVFNFPGQTTIYALKIVITKIQYVSAVAVLVEFGASIIVDVSSRVKNFSILEERAPDNATLEVGTASAGQLTLVLDNTDGVFGPHNAASPYYGLLRANRQIAVQLGFNYGSSEYVPFGLFYTMAWSAIGGDGLTTVTAQDRMKRLREIKYKTCPLSINKTVDQIMITALTDAGFTTADYVINPSTVTIPYAWVDPSQSFFTYLKNLAGAAGGVIYMDENNILHFEDSAFLRRNRLISVITLTDLAGIITPIDAWDEGEVKNTSTVQNNAISLATLAQVWALSETLTVRASATLTYTVIFSGGVTNVQTPVLVDVDAGITILSWTVYAQSGILVLTNSAATDGKARSITIQAQALQTNGNNIVTAQDVVYSNLDGPRDISVNNPFIQSSGAAQALANNLVTLYKNPPAKINVQCQGLPHVELGDRMTINSTKMGINSDFWIVRHNLSHNPDNILQSDIDGIAVVDQLPTRATMWHQTTTIVSGQALVISAGGGERYNGNAHFATFTLANGTVFTNSMFLASGIYQFWQLGYITVGGGIVDWYMDGIKFASQDWYNASSVLLYRTLDVSLAYDGYHVLKGIMNGKNASSTGYSLDLVKMYFKQVND